MRGILSIRLLLIGAAVALLGVFVVTAAVSDRPVPSCDGCNVVLISIDPLRADHVGAYGYPRNTTPTIDRIARNAIIFRDTYTQSSHTLTALMSTFTSLFVSQHGVSTSNAATKGFSTGFTTLPEVLNQSGYRTLAITGGEQVAGRYGFRRGFDTYIDNGVSPRRNISLLYSHMKDVERPFFLFYQSFATHPPYMPPDTYANIYNGSNRSFRDDTIARRETVRASGRPPGERWEMLMYDYYIPRLRNDSRFAAHAISQYDASIRGVDDSLAGLLDLLERTGNRDDTIIIVTSQHGEMLGEHGEWLHFENLYEEVLQVPLIIKVPGQEQQINVERRAQLIDLAPTLLDLLGRSSEQFAEQAEGRSLLPFLDGSERIHDVVFAEGLNIQKKVFIDTRSNLKYYRDPVGHISRVYNISDKLPDEKRVDDPAILAKMRSRFQRFYREITKADISINGSQPYFPE